MKMALYLAVFAMFFPISTVLAASRVGSIPEGMCTRDLNPWAHASRCSCDAGQAYDERAGLCLEGDTVEKVVVQGAVTAGMMAIGGETAGFVIKTPEGEVYELILMVVDQEKLTKLSEMWFEIEGELIIRKGIEIKERPTIIVERIAVLE